MKDPQLFITPKDEPYTVVSGFVWRKDNGDAKGKFPWAWMRVQEVAALRYVLHQTRETMMMFQKIN